MKNNNEQSDQRKKRKILMNMNLDEIKEALQHEFREAKEFYLDEDRISSLDKMGRLKRGFLIGFWLLKGLYLKLTPIRRFLVAISIIFILMRFTVNNGDSGLVVNFQIIGGLLLLFVLMLELKDKLLARDELAAGRSVQLALMPESSPKIPGWDVWLFTRPANEVGGDLVDYIKLDSNRYGLVLGDVAGKGLSAALFMAKLQSTLRALAFEFDSLSDLGSKINGIFYRDTISKSFASLIYLELHSESEDINLLNAGHLPPLLLKNNRIQVMSKGDVALGLKEQIKHHITNIKIKKSEVMVLYSDGVSEAQNKNGDFFGQEKLISLIEDSPELSSKEIGEKVLDEITQFVGKSKYHDDLSMVILKRF